MQNRLTLTTILILTTAPLMWAGNAVVGRMANGLVSPLTLNLLRWTVALLVLLPLAGRVLKAESGLWKHWRRYALLGTLSVGAYNALLYLALQTSSPINVTLVGASMPVWMQLIGRLFFSTPISRRQMMGALISIVGVLLVLARGQWQTLLHVQLVPGDFYILLATISWAFYSWLLTRPDVDPPSVRGHWGTFLLAQVVFGVIGSLILSSGEWALGYGHITLGWSLAAVVLFVAIGPALLAYVAWGEGVRRAGPTVASFFVNLIPLFAAVLSAALLGEHPQAYHGVAFALIIVGIAVSSRRPS